MKMRPSRIANPVPFLTACQMSRPDIVSREHYAELTAVSSDVKLRSHCNACHKGAVLADCPACQRLSVVAK